MTNFGKFKEAFEAVLEDQEDGLYGLLEYGNDLPFGGVVVLNEAENISDSYGWTDDLLTKVIYFDEFDVYVKFTGREASYSGLEWHEDYQEVKPITKTITTYE